MSKLFFNKTTHRLIGFCLICLSFGFLTSVDIMILAYCLLALVSSFFIFKTNWRAFNLSSWALVGFFIAIQLSLLANMNTLGPWNLNGILRGTIYLLAVLFIVPLSWYFFKNGLQHNKINILIYALCIGALLATIYGLVNLYTDYGLTKMKIKNRNGGMFYELLIYAYNLSFCLIIFIGIMVQKYSKLLYRFLIPACILLLWGLFTTYSRASWLSFLCAIPFLYSKKTFYMLFILVMIIGGGAYYIGKGKLVRTNSSVRTEMWKSSIQIFKEKPLLGNGFLSDVTAIIPAFLPVQDTTYKIGLNYQGNLQEFTHNGLLYNKLLTKHKELHGIPKVEAQGSDWISDYKYVGHAHNNFFQLLANTGIIGCLFFVAWIVLWFLEMYKRKDALGRISLALIVCFVVGGLTQSTIIVAENLFFIMIIYAVSQVDRKHIERFTNKAIA